MNRRKRKIIRKLRRQIAELEALEQPGAGERLMKEMRKNMKEAAPCTK